MSLILLDLLQPGVARITLNDPASRNAMSEEMAGEFRETISKLRSDSALRAVVITGAPGAFSAGGDLEMLSAKRKLSGEENRRRMLDFYHSFLSIRSLSVPVVAAINGHAIGAGLCLATACDIRLAVKGAKFGYTFGRLGLFPGMGSTYSVPRLLGPAKAADLLLTGRIFQSEEALTLGLVSQVVDPESLMATTTRLLSEMLCVGPVVIRQMLPILRGHDGELSSFLEREAALQSLSYLGDEFAEGIESARAKRAPGWAKP